MELALKRMLFNGWTGIWHTVLVGALAYLALLVLLRVSGKRTLSKMNAFDLVVTVALGSTLATVLLSKDVALAEGITAFVTLVLLQLAIAWLSVRSKTVRQWVKAEPTLLFHQDRFMTPALVRERVTEEEVIAAIRAQGLADLHQVAAAILETDGSFSVLRKTNEVVHSTLPGESVNCRSQPRS